ncbi:MAG: hypothetical protein ACTTH7_03035 [Treponema sp.]
MSRYCPAALFQYQCRNSCIHKQPAAIKFLVFCICSIGVSYRYLPFALFYTVCLVCICIAARLSLRTVKQNVLFLLWYAVIIFLLKITGIPLSLESIKNVLQETALFMHNFALILFTASVFYETTSRAELLTLCEQIEYIGRKLFLRRKRADTNYRLNAVSLTVTLTLLCIPYIFETWAALNYAYTARCGRKRTVHAVCTKAAALIPALIENVLLYAVTAEKAITNRTEQN